MKHNVFITGGAGYVGAMLCEQFLLRADVDMVIALDKEGPKDIMIDLLENTEHKDRLIYIKHDMSKDGWQEKVARYNPEIVIHTAWQIREIYGDRGLSYRWNITGSDKIFDFAFDTVSVKKLIHFSTVASYGAFADNSTHHFFTEEEKFRETNYLYAEEKRQSEKNLENKYKNLSQDVKNRVQVFILRPAAITGPRGRVGRIRFGLQSALSGSLKGTSFINNVVSALTSFVPITTNWLRQYIHEDDVTDIVTTICFGKYFESSPETYEVFNIAPGGKCVMGPDMAKAVNKRYINIHPQIIRFVFFFMWHATRGRIPTGEGVWKGYSYPIPVDGSKISKRCNYDYRYNSHEAFTKNEGRYSGKNVK